MTNFYIYELVDPRNGKIFYVGKGSNGRYKWHTNEVKHGRTTGNPHKDRVIKNILDAGLEPLIGFPYENITNEADAYVLEERVLKEYGIENLTNLVIGNNPPRVSHTVEQKEKYRQVMIGNTINKGRIQTEEEKSRRGETLKRTYASGKRVPSEKQIAAGFSHKNKLVSKETCKKISESRIGRSLEDLWGIEAATAYKIKLGQKVIVDGILFHTLTDAEKTTGLTYRQLKKLQKSQNDQHK